MYSKCMKVVFIITVNTVQTLCTFSSERKTSRFCSLHRIFFITSKEATVTRSLSVSALETSEVHRKRIVSTQLKEQTLSWHFLQQFIFRYKNLISRSEILGHLWNIGILPGTLFPVSDTNYSQYVTSVGARILFSNLMFLPCILVFAFCPPVPTTCNVFWLYLCQVLITYI